MKTSSQSRNSEKPFIKRFRTEDKFYVYDVNTNLIMDVDGVIYDILGEWGVLTKNEIFNKHKRTYGRETTEKALAEVDAAILNQNYFMGRRQQKMTFGLSLEEWEEMYRNRLRCITLELTEHCNLQCHYCGVEPFRHQRRKHMHSSTARQALLFLKKRSKKIEKRSIGFYGGETLLKFSLLRNIIQEGKNLFGEKGVRFNITTNGLLMTPAIAGFFASNKCNVRVSLDGPREVHDRHRVDRSGNGSYDRATRALKLLLDAYGDAYNRHLGLVMTLTPPNDVNEAADLWRKEPWLPKDIFVSINNVNTEWTDFLTKYAHVASEDIALKGRKDQFRLYKEQLFNHTPPTPIPQGLFEQGFLKLYKRPISLPPRLDCQVNGCCIPGVRKLLITATGALHICERCHGTPTIGDVWQGYDKNAIRSTLDAYIELSLPDCRDCWAVALCGLCFAHCFENGKFSLALKRKTCESARRSLKRLFVAYCGLLEEDIHTFDFMEEFDYA